VAGIIIAASGETAVFFIGAVSFGTPGPTPAPAATGKNWNPELIPPFVPEKKGHPPERDARNRSSPPSAGLRALPRERWMQLL
jgi:hypothetical protein